MQRERERERERQRQTDRQRETERDRERERERVPFAGCCDAAGGTGSAERLQVDDGGLCA